LAIAGVVTETQVSPQGETEVGFVVPEREPGVVPILLGREQASTGEVRPVSGGPDLDLP